MLLFREIHKLKKIKCPRQSSAKKDTLYFKPQCKATVINTACYQQKEDNRMDYKAQK
jgi:hypothetical protein